MADEEKRSKKEVEADIAIKLAEVKKNDAETRKTIAEAIKAEAEAEAATLELKKIKEMVDKEKALYD